MITAKSTFQIKAPRMTTTSRRIVMLSLFVSITACSPRLHPIVLPLDDETRMKVDRLWNKLLENPSDPDRELVLDAIVLGELHHTGVDQFWFRAEKRFDEGFAVITSQYDRYALFEGSVTVEILDRNRSLLRRLTYSDREVFQVMFDMRINPETKQARMFSESNSNDEPRPTPVIQPKATDREVELRKQRVEALIGDDQTDE